MSSSRTDLTNHGAKLTAVSTVGAKPLREQWLDTPVPLRADIAKWVQRERLFSKGMHGRLSARYLLARAMDCLSLRRASFDCFSSETDAAIKRAISKHHQVWIMSDMEAVYDLLVQAEEKEGKR